MPISWDTHHLPDRAPATAWHR